MDETENLAKLNLNLGSLAYCPVTYSSSIYLFWVGFLICDPGTKVIMFVLFVPLWTEDFWESGLQIVKPHIIIFVIDTHISVVPSNWGAEGRGLDSSTGFPLKTILHKGFGLRAGHNFFLSFFFLWLWHFEKQVQQTGWFSLVWCGQNSLLVMWPLTHFLMFILKTQTNLFKIPPTPYLPFSS